MQCEPLKSKVQRILAWRWRDAPYTEVPDDRPGHEGNMKKLWGYKQREFLVKYADFSYWDIEWVVELRMEMFCTHQVGSSLILLSGFE